MAKKLVKWPKILFLGDSLTQFSWSFEGCFGSIIADRLQRKADVIVRGFSGYNTNWCRQILPRIVAKDDGILSVVIFLGTNDSNIADLNPKQHVPLDDYENNLIFMAQFLQKELLLNPSNVILITPPSCDLKKYNPWCQSLGFVPSKTVELTRSYAEACIRAAKKTKSSHLNLFDLMMQEQNWEDFLIDGIHLSHSGSNFLAEKLWPLLEAQTSHLPSLFPMWRDIDPKDYRDALDNWKEEED